MGTLLLPPPDIIVRNNDRQQLIQANRRARRHPAATPLKPQKDHLILTDAQVVADLRKASRSAAVSKSTDPRFLKDTRDNFLGNNIPVPQILSTSFSGSSACKSQDSSLQSFPIRNCDSRSIRISHPYLVQKTQPSALPCSYVSLSSSSGKFGMAGLTSLVACKFLPEPRDGCCGYTEERGKNDVGSRHSSSHGKLSENVLKTSANVHQSAKLSKAKTMSKNLELSNNSSVSRRSMDTNDSRESKSLRSSKVSAKPGDAHSFKFKKTAKKISAVDKFHNRNVTYKTSNASVADINNHQKLQTQKVQDHFSEISGISTPKKIETAASIDSTTNDNNNLPKAQFMENYTLTIHDDYNILPQKFMENRMLTKPAGDLQLEARRFREQTLICSRVGGMHKDRFRNDVYNEGGSDYKERIPVSDVQFNFDNSAFQEQKTKNVDYFRNPLYSTSQYLSEHWAGPGYTISPPPSCLPIPYFAFTKAKKATKFDALLKHDDYECSHVPATFPSQNLVSQKAETTLDTDIATKDLRRMLHLDLQ